MPGIFADKIEESKPVLPRAPKNHHWVINEKGNEPAPIVPLYGSVSYYGETPEVSFKQMMDYYEKTPQIKLAVDTINEMIFGTNLVISIDEKFEEAKEVLDKWNESTQFYEKLQALGITLLSTGNALLEKLDEKDIEDVLEVDMTTIIGKHRDETGMRVEYYMQQVPGYTPKRLGEGYKNAKGIEDAHIRFVEFNLTNYSRKEWGRSIFYSLAVPRTVNGTKVKPLVEDFWEAEDSMSRIFHNFASPMMFITYAEADKEFIDKKVQEFKKMKPGDALIGTRKPEIDIIESDARGKFDKFVDHLDSTLEVGTQFSNQLFTAGYTARASSETTHDLINKKVRKLQKYITDKIKNEIYKPILLINNYTDDEINSMNLEISFENDDFTDFVPQDVINMVINGIMTVNEARNWAKNQGLDMFDDELAKQLHIVWIKNRLGNGDLGDDTVTEPKNPQLEPVKQESKKRLCESCKEGQHSVCSKRGCKCKHG
ncbi:MAG: hypothetical protein KGI08_04980 [Thaumarchaeota archaeon]|nr:hypothetical protein [Nitrososphaerota archaeon]